MRKILLVPVLLLSLLMPLCADAPVITLNEAIESAMENSTDMEIARLTLQSSLRDASNASQYIPDLSLTGIATFDGSIKDQSWSNSGIFSAGISMRLGTSLIGSTAVNNANRTIANLTYAMSLSSREQAVTTAYWELVSLKRSIESKKDALETVERSYEQIASKYEVGLATSSELSEAELKVLEKQYELKQSQDAYVLAQDVFRTLTGIEGEFDVTDFPEIVYLSLPTAEELYNKYGENSNTIKKLHASVSLSEAYLTSAQVSSLYPSLSLSLNYGVDGTTDFKNSNSFGDGFSATVTASIPISSYIPGSSANNSLKNGEDSVAISKLELNAGRKEYISNLRNTLTKIEQSRSNIEILSKTADIAQDTYDLALESYNAGISSLSDLQDKMDKLNTAQMNLINAESEYIQNVYSLSFMLDIDYESLVTLYAEK